MERKWAWKFLALLPPLLILAQSPQAAAQVALPNVRLPNLSGGLPATGLPLNGDRTLSGLSDDLDPRRLEDLRRLHLLDLIRKNPKEIEADPNGAPILRGEVVAFSPSDAALEKARAAGFAVLRERALDGLDARLVILKAPDGTATRRALKQLRGFDPEGVYDFNHLYSESGEVLASGGGGQDGSAGERGAGGASAGSGEAVGSGVRSAVGAGRDVGIVSGAGGALRIAVGASASRLTGAIAPGAGDAAVGSEVRSAVGAGRDVGIMSGAGGALRIALGASASGATGANAPGASGAAVDGAGPSAGTGTKIGLVDGGVDISHDVFRDIVIHQHGCTELQVPAAQMPAEHGTAAREAGERGTTAREAAAHGTAVASLMIGRSPRFHGAAPGSELYAADVYCGLPSGGAVDAVADALAWLVREHVPVINVSLVGPPNFMLENVIRLVIARGHVVVAAVGNDGPAAPPLYPASYPDVVGVTGVDAHQRVLLEACRGRQVKFAAPGADMSAANPAQSYVVVRGTSFASPIVAGLLAQGLREPDKGAAQRAVADLAAHAVDLGAPGPDPVYGFGLVGGDLRPELALAGNRSN